MDPLFHLLTLALWLAFLFACLNLIMKHLPSILDGIGRNRPFLFQDGDTPLSDDGFAEEHRYAEVPVEEEQTTLDEDATCQEEIDPLESPDPESVTESEAKGPKEAPRPTETSSHPEEPPSLLEAPIPVPTSKRQRRRLERQQQRQA